MKVKVKGCSSGFVPDSWNWNAGISSSIQTKTRISILAQSFGSGSAQPLGCVWVGANFQFQLSFDIAASREKLREASENNSFKTASSVSAAPGPHNHWISEPRHYERLFKSNWVDWSFAFSSHNNSCPTILIIFVVDNRQILLYFLCVLDEKLVASCS